MNPENDHILHNIKQEPMQEPEVSFELILPKVEVEEPSSAVNIEQSSEEFSAYQNHNQEKTQTRDYIANIKQEPEVSFRLKLPTAEIDPLKTESHTIEQNSTELSFKFPMFDQGRQTAQDSFETYRKCEKCDLMYVTERSFRSHREKCVGNQMLECDFCGRIFKTKRNLATHMRIHIKDTLLSLEKCGEGIRKNIFVNRCFCEKCGKGFRTNKSLIEHQKSDKRINRCFLCDMKFDCKSLKDQHIKEVHMKCPKCQFTVKNIKNMLRTLQNHHKSAHENHLSRETRSKKISTASTLKNLQHKQENHLSCETCSKKFSKPYDLKNHQLQHKHGIFKNTSITFDCDQCTKSFSVNKNLKSHLRKSHGDKPYFQCDICSNAVPTKQELRQHMKLHIKDPCYICNQCEASFPKLNSLRNHERCVHSKLSLQCEICGGIFKGRKGLVGHMTTHAKIHAFFCDKCGTGFKAKRQLVVHMNKSKRIKKCYLCDKEFECTNMKKQHLKEVHKKDLKCPKCSFAAKNYSHLKDHHYSMHIKTRFSCETCSEKFTKHSVFKAHQLKQKHGIYKDTAGTFNCDECSKLFSSNRYFKAHQKKIHDKERFQCDICSKFFTKTQLLNHLNTHIKVACHVCKKSFNKNNFTRHLKLHSKP